MKYAVPTKLVFGGTFYIEAESAAQAKELVKRNCDLVIENNIHFILGDENFDLAFSLHPDKITGRSRRVK